jgi:phospholipid/cholesterol/gamma-HCH transport system substrate-binding protein
MYDYIKQFRWAKLKVGIVITIALAVVFLAVMFAGNIEKIFTPEVTIYAFVDDVKGLREGSPVWFSGVEIGSVRSIDFTIQQKVKVEISISSGVLAYLKKDSKANILTLGLLGDKYVEITPGSKESATLKAGDVISGKTQIEIQDVVQTSQASIAKISDFISMLQEILLKIENGKGSVSKFLRDPSVYDNLKEATEELSTLIKKIEGSKGTIGRLLNEDSIYFDLSSSVEDIKLFAKTLKESEGTLNKLINDPSLYDRFQKASESLDAFTQRIASSEGTVSKLIEDDSLYENINSASEKLDRLLERIDKGGGLVGSLVKDEELSDEFKTTLRDLNALVKDIKENPGKYFKFSLF